MDTVTIREIGIRGGEVVDRVASGESVTVTRDGHPVAELRPIPPSGLSAPVLLERWRHVPVVDAGRLRRDVDRVVDQPGRLVSRSGEG